MALLDVNALVALAWDSHVHHVAIRSWFAAHAADGWVTCPATESGPVRASSDPKVLPHAIATSTAREVLAALRRAPATGTSNCSRPCSRGSAHSPGGAAFPNSTSRWTTST